MRHSIIHIFLIGLLLFGVVYVERTQGITQSSADKKIQMHLVSKTIVLDSKPCATIVLSKSHSQREKQAAKEIQHYVEKSTSALLPITSDPNQFQGHLIRLLVEDKGAKQSSEAFSIHVKNNDAEIIGNSSLGVLYGAYEFLERVVGVRWYLPDSLGEIVPKRKTITVPNIDTCQSPNFPMRWVGDGEWMLRNKQNNCNDGFKIAPGIYHTQNRLLPRGKYHTAEAESWQANSETFRIQEDYFKSHPEYFSLVDGKRSNVAYTKLCYSNPEVACEVAKNMTLLLQSDPNIDLISFSPTDGQMWCECEHCRAMDEETHSRDRSKSRRSLLFYNKLANELRKTCPTARILVGAYNEYNSPPIDEGVKADPMLSIIITHYEDYCMAHPVCGPQCSRNRDYVALIKEWEQHVGKEIYIYEYYWKMNWLGLPWPIVHCIKKDIPWYRDEGYRGVYTQYSTQNIWTLFPNYYVAAKLLWDADADVDLIVNEMYDDLFGTAAQYMKSYYGLMEKQMAASNQHFPGGSIDYNPKGKRNNALLIFTPEVRKQLRRYYDQALASNQDETVAQRLKKVGTSLEYVERLMHYADLREEAKRQKDFAKKLAIAEQALISGETLLDEIRNNRTKWNGIVAEETVRPNFFMGKSIQNWKKYVSDLRTSLTEL